ncbi:hypothetical protein CCY99_05785 [Helicobacter sp. 16-1353]|uniref:hypothetical protein n=1 Tax=Helicobacter sp. 16-1353 TaxID=2004996 RepID=UPI000DCC9E73|nr:hypothetical protein [Helicobacter sp. 16-1353]RAX53889.1 hypothetical protein CCY99_05785 [Helicobacter sp. 16-1353]
MKFFKVLKYEFLENLTSIILLNGILLALMLFIRLIVGNDNIVTLHWILALLVSIAPIGILCSIIFLTIIVIKSLYSRLFNTEGYLTLSLPVSLDSILISKIFVSSIWILLSIIIFMIWVFLMAESLEINLLKAFFTLISQSKILYIIYYLWIMFLWTIKPIVALLLTLTLLNIGKITRFKPLMGIIIFFVLMFLENLCFGFIKMLFYEMVIDSGFRYINPSITILGTLINNSTQINSIVLIESCITILIILFYYFICRYLIKNKLEI